MAETIPCPGVTDANPQHRPASDLGYTLHDDPENYLTTLAEGFVKKYGTYVPGRKYVLDRLPSGYAVYGRNRAKSNHVDKYLYGHPAGESKTYRSPNEFLPHFLHLVEHDGDTQGCPCKNCGRPAPSTTKRQKTTHPRSNKSVPPLNFHGAASGKGKQRDVATSTVRIDEEGNPDVLQNLIDKLKQEQYVDQPIMETMSLDWRAEMEAWPPLMTKYFKQAQWIPRIGDLVMFVRTLPEGEELRYDPEGKACLIYNPARDEYKGRPLFEAGVIAQAAQETVHEGDLLRETTKTTNVTHSGFRVEPLPDPNRQDKSLSSQYKYIPMHHIRPFVFFQDYLEGVPEEEWHPTVKHALTVMSTFAIVKRAHFKGTWPTAAILCSGLYIGSELIISGDIVRLTPAGAGGTVTDCVKVTTIHMHLTGLDAADEDDYHHHHLSYRTTLHITGKGYTRDAMRGYTKQPLDKDGDDCPPVLAGYDDDWYPLHDSSKSMVVPFQRIMGRVFERPAMVAWFTDDPEGRLNDSPDLQRGTDGLVSGRQYSKANYRHIKPDKSWYWADNRVEALDIETVNGELLSLHDPKRDVRAYRKAIKIMEGEGSAADHRMVEKWFAHGVEQFPVFTDSPNAWQAINDPPNVLRPTPVGAVSGAGLENPYTVEDEMPDDEVNQFIDDMAGRIGLPESDGMMSEGSGEVVANDLPRSTVQVRIG